MPSIFELQQMQSLPLEVKLLKTKARIKEWVDYYGVDGVYLSFSGGKDSTVLLHIARSMYPEIKAVFSDTGLELPSIRNFVKTFDNVDWLKPKLTFPEVVVKYGYPLFGKEISHSIWYARKIKHIDTTPPPRKYSSTRTPPNPTREFEEKTANCGCGEFFRAVLSIEQSTERNLERTIRHMRKRCFPLGKQRGTDLRFLTKRSICLLAKIFPFLSAHNVAPL